ncbi:MAG: dTDP-4-dehydrorhamnose reductase [Myxococcales bacterium]|nr:dTDP-4-dehydrorhamnose reductase [Myxococcales bacterium]
MTIVIVGGSGQLGRALMRSGAAVGRPMVGLDRAALDVTDPDEIAAALDAYAPTAVVNAAAYTAVDRAEVDRLAAFAVNATGAGLLARACAARGVRLVHVSTDHVFDGRAGRPYREDDPVAPVNVYGASKAAGERAVLAAGGTVVRTSWLFAPDGWGFVPAIVRAAVATAPIRAIADRHGRPTCVDDLAPALVALLDAPAGVYHYAGAGVTTWHGLACAIVEALGADATVEPIAAAAWPAQAPRPVAAVLDTARVEALSVPVPSWRPGLARAVAALRARASAE